MPSLTTETEQLLLRRFEHNDAQAMFENWASHPDNLTYLTWPAHDNPETTRTVLSQWLSDSDPLYHHWAIIDKTNQVLMGDIAIVDYDKETLTAEIGYVLGKGFWGRGIMTEALTAIIALLFEKTDTNRIQAKFDTENVASGRVMAKSGMLYEGTLRQSHRNNRGLVDVALYAIVKSDYLGS